MRASHTSGTNCDIACLEILKVYMRLVKESPLARKRRVAASLMDGEIDCLNLVFSFDILPPIIFKRHSKSVGVILRKFLNPDPSSNFRVSKRSSPCVCPPTNNWRVHQRLDLLFLLCSRSNTRDADIAARASSCDMTARNDSRQTC